MAQPSCKVRRLDGGNALCHLSQLRDVNIVKSLVKIGMKLSVPESSAAPIFQAVQARRLDVLKLFIRSGANVNAVWRGSTPLHLADNVVIAETLLINGAFVHSEDGSGHTPLYCAVIKNRKDLVVLLVKYGAVNDWRERSCATTPLHVAVKQNNFSIALFLVTDAGTTVDCRDESNSRPLHYAVSNNYLAMVDLLLNHGADPNCMNSSSKRPVHLAIENFNLDTTAHLIAAGAYVKKVDVLKFPSLETVGSNSFDTLEHLVKNYVPDLLTTENNYGVASFLKAAYVDSKTEVMKVLLKRGCDIYLPGIFDDDDEEESESLHVAARQNDLPKVDELLNSGADPNAENWVKRTALHQAVENCNLDMVVRLINAGANVNAIDQFGNFPLILAVENNSVPILKHLLESGADVNLGNQEDFTSIHQACLNESNIEVLKLLLEAGCNVNAQDDSGNRPIHVAVHQNNRHKVDLLINAGAEVNVGNLSNGDTPLHLAIHCNLDVVISLVNAGADLNAEDDSYDTPFYLAARQSSDLIIKFLIRKHSDLGRIRDNFGFVVSFDDDEISSEMIKYAVLCNNKSSAKLFSVSESDLQKYSDEVHKMRNHFIGESYVSLWDFLYEDDEDKLVSYFSNMSTMTSSEVKAVYAEPYPEYSSMIMDQFRLARNRALLLQKSKLVMQQSKLVELPLLVRDKIFRLLTNYDLNIIINCNRKAVKRMCHCCF